MEYKNIYVTGHGIRIKDSYFALEPNVRVYTSCSDSNVVMDNFSVLLRMRYLLKNNSNISDYINIIKIYNKYLNNIDKYVLNTTILLKKIEKEKNRWIKNTIKGASIKLEKVENEIKTIDKIIKNIEESNKKYIKKYISILKKANKLKKKKIYIRDNIKSYLKGNFEKLKTIYKEDYEYITKLNILYKKYGKNDKRIKYLDYAYKHQYGLKKESLNYYNHTFNPCIFSGNLNNRIRKYIKNIVSKDLLDLHICPNVIISLEEDNVFRDYISEYPINIEIRNSKNEIIANKEEIQILINKYIQKTLKKKDDLFTYLFENEYSSLEELMHNRTLITTLINFTKKYNDMYEFKMTNKKDKLVDIKKKLKKNIENIEIIKANINDYKSNHNISLEINLVESDYKEIIKEHRKHIKEIEVKLMKLYDNFSKIKNSKEIKEIKEIDEKIKELNMEKNNYILIIEYIDQIISIKNEEKHIEKRIKEMEEEHDKVNNEQHTFYVNKSKDVLFYPLQDWGDCNIKTPFGSILNEYIKRYLENYHVETKNVEDILFRYYDIRKSRYLNMKECYQKHKKESNSGLEFNLRDLLIYLYNYYGLNENPNLKLDVDISALCLSRFAKPDKIYKTSRLNVYDYCRKLYKIDGKTMTLRDYDNNVSNNEKVIKEKVKGRRIKKSCSLYKKKDGCPSHCDEPADEKSFRCVVKSRKRKYMRKDKI